MSIVLKLQKKCLNPNESLQNLLREALVISTKLKLFDFKEWINYELTGYEKGNIPSYREIGTTLKFFNRYHGWITATINSQEISDLYSYTKIGQPIGELEELLRHESKGDLTIAMSHTQIAKTMELFSTDCQPQIVIDKTQIYGVVEKVRNILLEWTLKLEEDNILGNDDLIFSETEKEAAKGIHIEHFHGNIGNISTGHNSININDISIRNNAIDNLIKEIENLDLSDKQEIINDLEASKNDNAKAKTVLGKLLTKGSEVASISSTIIDLLGLIK